MQILSAPHYFDNFSVKFPPYELRLMGSRQGLGLVVFASRASRDHSSSSQSRKQMEPGCLGGKAVPDFRLSANLLTVLIRVDFNFGSNYPAGL